MMIVARVLVGLVLLAHGLVHLLYLASDVHEFSLEGSWLLPAAGRRPMGLTLMAATVATFALVALAVWGAPGLSALWMALVITASVLSIVLLAAFWNSSLVFGVAIDVFLLAIAVLHPEWADRLVGGSA